MCLLWLILFTVRGEAHHDSLCVFPCSQYIDKMTIWRNNSKKKMKNSKFEVLCVCVFFRVFSFFLVCFCFCFLRKISHGPLSIFWRKNKKICHSGYNQVKFWPKKRRLFNFCLYWIYGICSYISGTKHLSIIHTPAYFSPFKKN